VIGEDEGLEDISCQGIYQPAALRARDGRLWFATRRGVLAIDPTVQLAQPQPPPVAIEEIRYDDKPVPFARPFTMDGRVRKLEIRFGVLNLSSPERVHAKYRLDEFDADWVVAPPSRVATYPRLPPGQYRFRVMASNGDGAANEVGDTIVFAVAPRWWQTWWFRIGVFALGALGVAWSVRAWSHQRLRRRLDKLERERAIERERTRIAQNIHDDLGASLTRISLLSQHARHANSSGAGYYDQIYHTAADITRTMDEIVWAVNPKYDNIENLAGYLGNFAQSFLSVAGIRCRLDVPGELPHITLTSQARHHLFLCCKETLNNVVKHANADEVTISFAVRAPHLVISIADNGRGYGGEVPAGRIESESRAASGTGLESLRRRMTELGGQCDIHSVAGRGSTVTFTVAFGPLGN
jgi:signal transduction histidine kinase